MHQANNQFQKILSDIMTKGTEISTRNSICKRLIYGQMSFDKTPLISVRRTAWRNALREMEWFLSGSNDINDLHHKVRHWWQPWASESGYVHNNYSKQFRNFDGHGHRGGAKYCASVDQIAYLLQSIKEHPYSRRAVITTWHTHDMVSPNTPITNCHGTVIQAFVEPDNSLHMYMHQRSSDMVLGLQHNLIQYWALLQWIAHRTKRKVGNFIWSGGDCHIYKDHYDMAQKIIDLPLWNLKANDNIPELVYNPTSKDFKAEDFSLSGKYDPIIKENLKMIV